jgi:hypothetical protein
LFTVRGIRFIFAFVTVGETTLGSWQQQGSGKAAMSVR